MIVFALFALFPYEGDELLGVYTTQTKAETARNVFNEPFAHFKIAERAYAIREYTLDAVAALR